MAFYLHKPSAPLNEHIEYIWYCFDENVTLKCLSLPLTRFELVINLSSAYKISDIGEKVLLSNNKGWVAGMHQYPTLTEINGINENIGVIFKPCGFAAFTMYSLNEFGNAFTDIYDLWGHEATDVRERLALLPTFEGKVNCLEEFLLTKLTDCTRPKRDLARYVTEQIESGTKERVKVYELCKNLNISRKTLNAYLQQYSGTNAAAFRRITSFNHVIHEMAAAPSKKLTQLSYDFNYFDQSHFINDFREFTGMSPRKYMEHVKYGKVDSGMPNYIML